MYYFLVVPKTKANEKFFQNPTVNFDPKAVNTDAYYTVFEIPISAFKSGTVLTITIGEESFTPYKYTNPALQVGRQYMFVVALDGPGGSIPGYTLKSEIITGKFQLMLY